MGAYERDDPSYGASRDDAGRRREARCEVCGVHWEDHSEAHCPHRHDHRPRRVKDAEAARCRTFWEVLTGAYGNGVNGVDPR